MLLSWQPQILVTLACAASALQDVSKEAILSRVLAGYNKDTRPELARVQELRYGTPGPDVIKMQMAVQNMPWIDSIKQSYLLEGYLRIWWSDYRLAYNASTSGLSAVTITSAGQLWQPDVYWEQSVEVKLGQESDGEMLRIYPDGSIFWSRQARLELRCNMGFGRLPFDVQRCLFLAGIYSDDAANVVLKWSDETNPLGSSLPTFETVAGEWAVSEIVGSDLVDA